MKEISANTINQYLVLKFIKKNFDADHIEVELVDEDSVRVIDDEGSEAIFKWDSKDNDAVVCGLKLAEVRK